MITDLHILYTHGLSGNFARLPRLYTALQQIEQQHGFKALRLDLGDACGSGVWHCLATEGRSMPMALDVLGYHAVNVVGMSETSRFKLKGVVTVGLVDDQHAWRYQVAGVSDETILISSTPTPAFRLGIVLSPADETRLADGLLFMAPAPQNHVGYVHLDLSAAPRLIQASGLPLEMTARPDPVVTAALELIEEEARALQRRDPS